MQFLRKLDDYEVNCNEEEHSWGNSVPGVWGKVSIALHKNFYTAPTESAVFMINNHVGAKGSDVIINYNHVGDKKKSAVFMTNSHVEDKRISCFHDKQPCGR